MSKCDKNQTTSIIIDNGPCEPEIMGFAKSDFEYIMILGGSLVTLIVFITIAIFMLARKTKVENQSNK